MALVRRLEQGLRVPGVGRLRGAKAVKSREFTYVWIVAARIESPGLKGKGGIAVWSTNSLHATAPMIFAVDRVAIRFSRFGTGPRISRATHGPREAKDCVEQALPAGR
jgi:hypothetical protein